MLYLSMYRTNVQTSFHQSTPSRLGMPLSSLLTLSLIQPSALSPLFLPSCHDLITELAGGRITFPPSVLFLSFISPSPLPCLLRLSLSLSSAARPLLLSLIHPCQGALVTPPAGYHGNLCPGHPLLHPQGDPVRPPWVT